MAAFVIAMLAASGASAFFLLRRKAQWRKAAPILLSLSLPLLLLSIAFSIEVAPLQAEKLFGHSIHLPITRQLSQGTTLTSQWDLEVWFPIYRNLFLISVSAGVVWAFFNLYKGQGRALAASAIAVAAGWGALFLYGAIMAAAPFS